jgi:hypothetical protein
MTTCMEHQTDRANRASQQRKQGRYA